jgi:WD40-like Beta Propeller Repeat
VRELLVALTAIGALIDNGTRSGRAPAEFTLELPEVSRCRSDMRRMVAAWALIMLVACSAAPKTEGASASGSPAATMPTATQPVVSPSASGLRISIRSMEGTLVFSDETNDIWSMRADGTRARPLTSAPAMEFDPTWSPDGSRIAYRHQTGDDGTTEIFVMDADGSDQRNLTGNDVADYWGPAWPPDGSSIAFNSAMGTGGIGLLGYTVSRAAHAHIGSRVTTSSTLPGRPTAHGLRSWRRSREPLAPTPTTTSS